MTARGPQLGAIHRRQDRACLGMDTDLFFRHDDTSKMQALRVCSRCPAVEECLEFALGAVTSREDYGVIGGTTVEQRKALRRKRAAQGRGAAA